MNKWIVALAGAAAGAGLMYIADPAHGRRRRARLREMRLHTRRTAEDVAGMTLRDVRHRLTGLAATTAARFAHEGIPDDDVLVARVRARLGRLVSHPGSIHVTAARGIVAMTGPVFEAELEQVLKGIAAVPGVVGIENRLEPHRSAADVPGLQGPGPRVVDTTAAWRRWTPAARFAAGLAGVALIAAAAPRRPLRAATGVAGVELLERAVLGK